MSGALLVALSLVLNALVPYSIVRYDLARASEEVSSRAWPDASCWSAVLAFGPLCLPVHFTKTRRTVRGLLLGVALSAACLAAEGLLVAALGAALGVP